MIIVDSNIVFSALLSANSNFLPILLDKKNKIVTPCNLFIEIFKHKDKLLKYSRLPERDLLDTLGKLLNNIQFVSDDLLSEMSLGYAFELCEGIDEEDILFVALTVEMNGLLWTGDKKLISGLQKRGFNKFFNP